MNATVAVGTLGVGAVVGAIVAGTANKGTGPNSGTTATSGTTS